jgi:hypothetical protein
MSLFVLQGVCEDICHVPARRNQNNCKMRVLLPDLPQSCSMTNATLLKTSVIPWASCHDMKKPPCHRHVILKLWGLVQASTTHGLDASHQRPQVASCFAATTVSCLMSNSTAAALARVQGVAMDTEKRTSSSAAADWCASHNNAHWLSQDLVCSICLQSKAAQLKQDLEQCSHAAQSLKRKIHALLSLLFYLLSVISDWQLVASFVSMRTTTAQRK